jgi:ubiquinone/menaquinone biosynthesis C-methylase UbiE
MGQKNVPSNTNPDVERFDQWAPTYDRSIMQRWFFGPIHTKMLDLLVREVPKQPPGCILDIGCGTGRLLRSASARWPGAQFIGVDPAERMILEARRLNSSLLFKLASAESLPFPDQTADLILSSLSFHHWADHQKGVQEIARVLRPGGWFCLADHVFQLARPFGDKVKSRNQIRELISGAGLTVRHHQRMGIRFVLITLAQK